MKKLIVSAFLVLSIFSLCSTVSAQVNSTKEPTSGKSVYVAGNPDLYPLEFYNEKTESYEGILPKIYQNISKQTGIDFSL